MVFDLTKKNLFLEEINLVLLNRLQQLFLYVKERELEEFFFLYGD